MDGDPSKQNKYKQNFRSRYAAATKNKTA